MDQHDVEVGVRRELGAAVAADGDQGDPDIGAAQVGVRLGTQLIGCGRALRTFRSGQIAA
jgi:hypothetical protein